MAGTHGSQGDDGEATRLVGEFRFVVVKPVKFVVTREVFSRVTPLTQRHNYNASGGGTEPDIKICRRLPLCWIHDS